jgi:hypothetical protein
MRFLIFALVLVSGQFVACSDDDGGGSSDAPEGLEEVCTQSDEVDTERIDVTSPQANDEVESPLTVTGEIDTANNEFWISVVNAEGEHLVDYPSRSEDYIDGDMSPFDVSVPPFHVGEETAACVWVYRENVQGEEGPTEAIRIPVTLLVNAAEEETEG